MPKAMRSGRHAPAHRILFPLACLAAAAEVPLWLMHWAGWLRGGTATGHAHEMLLGFATAVIGGFLFTRLSRPVLAAAVVAWLAGRLAVALDLGGWTEAVAAMAYPLALAVLAGLPFARTARSGHNLVFAPVLAGFPLAEGLYQAGRLGWLAEGELRGAGLAFDLVTAMLLVMGGRIIPAAMAGAMRAHGDAMAGRNLPALERVSLAGMAVAALAHVAGPAPDVAAAGWLLAGLAGLIRLSRWRPGRAFAIPSLWPLHVGYGLLATGLAAGAMARWLPDRPASAMLHAATIGGLGIIAATMMVRTLLQRERLPLPFPRAALGAVGLLIAAAVARVAAPLDPAVLMPVAALLWSLAFLTVAALISTLPLHTGQPSNSRLY